MAHLGCGLGWLGRLPFHHGRYPLSGGWAGSDRRGRLPDDWPQRVATVKARADGQCEWKLKGRNGGRFRCPNPGTDCDHINRGDDHSYVNLQWLCERHHKIKTSEEGNTAKAAIKAQGTRPPERHPGSIRRH